MQTTSLTKQNWNLEDKQAKWRLKRSKIEWKQKGLDGNRGYMIQNIWNVYTRRAEGKARIQLEKCQQKGLERV